MAGARSRDQWLVAHLGVAIVPSLVGCSNKLQSDRVGSHTSDINLRFETSLGAGPRRDLLSCSTSPSFEFQPHLRGCTPPPNAFRHSTLTVAYYLEHD